MGTPVKSGQVAEVCYSVVVYTYDASKGKKDGELGYCFCY